jgi:hypothetical protein
MNDRDLFTFPAARVETRWASPENPAAMPGRGGTSGGGRKGRPGFPVPAGATITLAEAPASVSGTIRRLWLTISDRSPEMLRGVRLDFFWDGVGTPAVSAPLSDFFGIELGRMVAFESAFLSSPDGRGFNCCLPMPFRSGMRLCLTNETARDIALLFYDVDYTVGDAHGPDTLYLHAHFRRENPTMLGRDYVFLPAVRGRGRFVGVNFGVRANRTEYGRTWWGEGEVKFYIDGDSDAPTLCGTGTEDYVGAAWGLDAFAHRYQGCPVVDGERGAACFYRYHVPDPLFFRSGLRGTIQQIGHAFGDGLRSLRETGTTLHPAEFPTVAETPASAESGGLLFERQDDWSSCAYIYLDRPQNDFPPLPPVAERSAGL